MLTDEEKLQFAQELNANGFETRGVEVQEVNKPA
jgi:hypothetical protein